MYTDPWSKDELAILAAHYPERGWKWAGWESLLPTRTKRAIQRKANLMGLKQGFTSKRSKPKRNEANDLTAHTTPDWTEDPFEQPILRLMESGMTPTQIDKVMGWPKGRCSYILSERWRREKEQQ